MISMKMKSKEGFIDLQWDICMEPSTPALNLKSWTRLRGARSTTHPIRWLWWSHRDQWKIVFYISCLGVTRVAWMSLVQWHTSILEIPKNIPIPRLFSDKVTGFNGTTEWSLSYEDPFRHQPVGTGDRVLVRIVSFRLPSLSSVSTLAMDSRGISTSAQQSSKWSNGGRWCKWPTVRR